MRTAGFVSEAIGVVARDALISRCGAALVAAEPGGPERACAPTAYPQRRSLTELATTREGLSEQRCPWNNSNIFDPDRGKDMACLTL